MFRKIIIRATTRVAPTERFVGATLVVALVGVFSIFSVLQTQVKLSNTAYQQIDN
jgi:hypothetical protein